MLYCLMSDGSPQPGWWQASDGKWYPPETHPSRRATEPSPPTQPASVSQPVVPTAPVAPVPPPAPSAEPAASPAGWWQASDGNWYPPEQRPAATPPVAAQPVVPPPAPRVADQTTSFDPQSVPPEPSAFTPPVTPATPATPPTAPVPYPTTPAPSTPPAPQPFAQPSNVAAQPGAPATQPNGWWQASDGNWYPPTATPGGSQPAVVPTSVQPVAPKPPTGKGVTIAATILGLLVVLAGIGFVATRDEPSETTIEAPGGSVGDDEAPADSSDSSSATPNTVDPNEGVAGGESAQEMEDDVPVTEAPEQFDDSFPDASDPVEIIGSDGEPWNVASAQALGNIEDYWARTMPEVFGFDYEPVSGGFYAYSSNEPIPPCARSGDDVANNAFYCGFEDVVAWDDELLFREVHEFAGDLGVGLILAHEIGHAVQERVGMEGLTVTLENQADCYAGAWIASVAENPNDNFQVQSADLDRALIQLVEIADQPGTGATDPFAHGNAFDRINGFRDGLDNGAGKCADYNDQNVVITQIRFRDQEEFDSDGNLPFITDRENDDLFDLMPPDIEDFWAGVFPDAFGEAWTPLAGGVQAFEEGRDSPTCGGEPVANKAYYCRTDDYIGMETTTSMRALYDQFGDLSPGVVLGAQYGYAVQARLGTGRDQLLNSLQADCYAGAWVQSILPANADGLVISAGDLNESVETLLLLGDESETDDIRGTGFERVGAFRSGVLEGVSGCGQYTP